MKRLLAMLLALCLIVALAACGDDAGSPASSGQEPASQETPAEETPFVEEQPPANALDDANPIPADTGTLTLTPQTFADANLILNLPEGVTVREEERTENFAHIYVTDDEGKWVLRFEPYIRGDNLVNNIDSTLIYDGNAIKEDWSRDVPATLAGFPARVWANNTRKGWLYPENESDEPAVDIVVDYGETLAGPWYGMYIRLDAQNPTEDTNIYELLYLRHVRAILNNFEVIATPDGQTLSAGGITLTFPARWEVLTGENGFVTAFHSQELSGGINFGTSGGEAATLATYWEGEQFTRSYGGREYACVIIENSSDDPDAEKTYAVRMYGDFSDKRALSIYASLRGYGPEDYKAFLDGELFTGVMESMVIDPDGYHEPGTASVDGFNTNRGVVTYTGSESVVEIPAVIGEYDTVVIGDRAFTGNSTVTSVTIPEGVTTIYPSAFEDCENLETVVLPETLIEIDANAFRNCPKLKDVKLPGGVTYVGMRAFYESGAGAFEGSSACYDNNVFGNSGFQSISIPMGSDISGESMFSNAQAETVILPEDLTALGVSAFSGCRNIRHLDIPSTLREIGENCFTNMGTVSLTLPEGLETIPDGCFNSTNMDVLVIPESVTRIGEYATFDGTYIVLQNPNVELGNSALHCEYLYIQDAKNFVFPDYAAIWADRVYLDGVYSPDEIQGNFAEQVVDSQLYLPMDATLAESEALDNWLLSIGCSDIAWIGTGKYFIPESTLDFETEDATITGYNGSSPVLGIPQYVMFYDDPFWLTKNVYSIADGAFANKGLTAVCFPGTMADGFGSRIFEGNDGLTDIWYNTVIATEYDRGCYAADTFAGIPDGVTVHLPVSIDEGIRADVEAALRAAGLPDSAVFDYYSLR